MAELLALARRARRRPLSLVTGNYEGVARLKLERAGIGDDFAAGQGGFGSDSEHRTSCRRSRARAPASIRASARS